MKISFTTLGAIDHAEVELGGMTLICGENNTGKTYVTYGIYGFLSFWHEGFHFPVPNGFSQELMAKGTVGLDLGPWARNPSKILGDVCSAYRAQLPHVFAAPAKRFADTVIVAEAKPSSTLEDDEFERSFSVGGAQMVISKCRGSLELVASWVSDKRQSHQVPQAAIRRLLGQVAKDTLFRGALPRPFIISAERTGAAMFKNELNLQRNRLIEEIGRADGDLDPFELLTRVYSDYPLPVKANIHFARKRETIAKEQSFIAKAHQDVLDDYADIFGGEFLVDREDKLRFTPKGTKIRLSMDESSSSVRSLLDLGLYLSCAAAPGDLLVIDEPELNLHPQNQRRLARLLSRLVRLGLRVLVTTHSDYLVKELNLLILMHTENPRIRAIAEREGYAPQEALDADSVRVYVASTENMVKPGNNRKSKCRTLVPVPVHRASGIEVPSFDRAIEDLNRIEDELVYGGD